MPATRGPHRALQRSETAAAALVRCSRQIPLLEATTGFWERAGRLRAKVISRRRRARLADTLIAQSCLDNDLVLITRDLDFRAFAEIADLKILAA